MANTFAVSRAQLIYAVCLPLAVLLGYLLADPVDQGNLAIVVLVVGVLSVPVVMRWYHPLLIFTWNAVVTFYFLPGRPYLWMIFALTGLFFAILNRTTSAEARFVDVPSIHRPVLFIAAVVVATAWLRGGIGVRSLGSAHFGGRNYFMILAGAAGYFAMISQRIPRERTNLYVGLFFLTGLTALVANLAFMAGSHFDFLYYIFPPELAQEQVLAENRLSSGIFRLYGLTVGSNAVCCWLMAQYGLRGVFDWKKPWRGLLLIAAGVACLYSGFRSSLGLFGLTLLAQLCCEGLFRPRVLILGSVSLVVGGLLLAPLSERLPLSIQRTISFLPVEISPMAKFSAESTAEWRFQMWKEVLPDIPRYLLKGKGYSFDPSELAFAEENAGRGYTSQYEGTIMVGDYHSGPLSVIIPFGIWGVIGFIWFLAATLRYLYRNYRDGDLALRQINTFLLAYFIARILQFIFVFGGFYSEFYVFAGLAGLSASLNGPIRAKEEEETSAETEEELAYHEGFTPGQLRSFRRLRERL
ncbi:MAG TPA: hypothetical protein VN578_01315 [Candidatus Binatia bacterium]|nr:hypothetical protein [Candidatus Binatia bacterium]